MVARTTTRDCPHPRYHRTEHGRNPKIVSNSRKAGSNSSLLIQQQLYGRPANSVNQNLPHIHIDTSLSIPRKLASVFIGVHGQRVNKMRHVTGAFISVDQEANPFCPITIRADSAKALEDAVAHIKSQVDEIVEVEQERIALKK